MSAKSSDLELQLRLETAEFKKEIDRLEEKVDELSKVNEELEKRAKNQDKDKVKMVQDTENRLK